MTCNHLNFGMTRREFFGRFGLGLGGVAMAGLFNSGTAGAAARVDRKSTRLNSSHG